MDNPQVTKDLNEKWLGGFFDAVGYCKFTLNNPEIGIINTNPIAISRCFSIFKNNDIIPKISDKSKPSKSSKKKRWDLFIEGKECFKAASFLKNLIYGKKEQMDLILEYKKYNNNEEKYHQKMIYLNQTNHFLINDDEFLYNTLGFYVNKIHENVNKNSLLIEKTDFNDIYYLSGILDGIGIISIEQKYNKYRDTDKFTPKISISNTNKEIISKCYSTIINSKIGCHILTLDNNKLNRAKWDICVSGTKRTYDLSLFLLDKLFVKRQQIEEIFAYLTQRINEPKGIDTFGYNYMEAINALNRQ